MRVGMMNDPRLPIDEEVAFAAEHGFDFLDLTLEPPRATNEAARSPRVQAAVLKSGLGVVGHTAYYLPIESAYTRLRTAALQQVAEDLRVLADLGATKVTLHFLFSGPERILPRDYRLDCWRAALDYLSPIALERGLFLMLENTESNPERIDLLDRLFQDYPHLRFHLDVGHANLGYASGQLDALLSSFHARLTHVHLSDNVGGDKDLHLPLYCGSIDWKEVAAKLWKYGYDDTVTLEIFSRRREYLLLSKTIWEQLWHSLRDPHENNPSA
ncbi:MAG: sugar phosphate isomerase/epimerase [candidate division KSB1 bacterium]|nr:sugar phosphate isomerase/epimerase [candidate division KSB1 bacterium]